MQYWIYIAARKLHCKSILGIDIDSGNIYIQIEVVLFQNIPCFYFELMIAYVTVLCGRVLRLLNQWSFFHIYIYIYIYIYIPDRVSDAYWHLRKFARTENVEKNSTKVTRLEVKNKVNGAKRSASASSVETKEDSSASSKGDLFDVVSFRQENFVQSQRPSEKQYDTILW